MKATRLTHTVLLLLLLVALRQSAGYAESGVETYLCDLGIRYYYIGRYEDALIEFKKALLLNPENQIAKDYINKLLPGPVVAAPGVQRQQVVEGILDRVEEDLQSQTSITELAPKTRESRIIEAERIAQERVLITERLKEPSPKREKEKSPSLKISGQADVRLGFTTEETLWKRANYDFNELDWRVDSQAGLDQRENTYDPRIFDRLRVNLDTDNEEGFNFHSNITVDPWSFTGRSDKVTVTSAGGETAEVELKYWSNAGYTVNEAVYSSSTADRIHVPEIKVIDDKTIPTTITSAWGDSYTIPELKIRREFQPVRELWFDYQQEGVKLRLFPFSYQGQALTTDDPLRLSNNFNWFSREESPWIRRWVPGRYNSGQGDFTKGYWDDSLSSIARDSDGTPLTNLRGFSFELGTAGNTSLKTTIAAPKNPWQEYSDVDNLVSATRLKHSLADNLEVAATYTNRTGFNLNEGSRVDVSNNVIGVDLDYELTEGLKASLEAAHSQSEYDLTNPNYETESRGNAYYFSLIGRYPRKSIMDAQCGYEAMELDKGEDFLAKMRFFGAHMDEGFDPSLSSYRETRNDEAWSRHIHFRKPFEYYHIGFYGDPITWHDIKPYRIGNGIDIGRDALGFRLETLWKERFDNLLDVRNVHKTDGGYIETVARDEATWKVNDKLTAKALGIYHDLPDTTAGIDPFVFDPLTDRYYTNAQIEGGKDPSLKTGSLGLEYQFFDWLALSGIWERTNDYTLGYDNFPHAVLDDWSMSYTWLENGNSYRDNLMWLYSQGNFPKPPYAYYDIFKAGLTLRPIEKLEVYLDYTRNEYQSAGQIDGNMNHIGLEVRYLPTTKLGCYLRYVYSRWQDLDRLTQGITKPVGHHNLFAELIYRKSKDEDFVLEYGESNRTPIRGEMVTVGVDPYGEGLHTIDTEHIIRLFYSRRF